MFRNRVHTAQVDHILVERLQATWQKRLLAGARGAAADLANRTDKHDAAQERFLGHKCAPHQAKDMNMNYNNGAPHRRA